MSSVAIGCSGEDTPSGTTEPAQLNSIPGLNPADEVLLVRTEPDPSNASMVWTHAYRVGNIGPINIGHPTPQFMRDALRDPAEAAGMVCIGGGGGAGCGFADDPARPNISGIGLGGPQTLAWAWLGVPEEAAAVQFTDHDGAVSWQRATSGLVIFRTTFNDPESDCPCRLDAIDSSGTVIASVDMRTNEYIDN